MSRQEDYGEVKTLGVFVRVQGGAYLAGFAVIEDDVLLAEDRFPAPPDEDLPRQLAELYTHTRDVVAHHGVGAVALKESEIQAAPAGTVARRAEGAVLAAVGEVRDLLETRWLRVRMLSVAGLDRHASSAEVAAALSAPLTPQPTTDETRQASAAARAAILTRR